VESVVDVAITTTTRRGIRWEASFAIGFPPVSGNVLVRSLSRTAMLQRRRHGQANSATKSGRIAVNFVLNRPYARTDATDQKIPACCMITFFSAISNRIEGYV
jgi:hypothetical protein